MQVDSVVLWTVWYTIAPFWPVALIYVSGLLWYNSAVIFNRLQHMKNTLEKFSLYFEDLTFAYRQKPKKK